MATALAIPNDLSLKKYFFRSMVCHALLTVALLAGSYFERQGALWGGVGGQPGGTKVNLVSSAGIPMPKEEMVTDSKTVDPTKRSEEHTSELQSLTNLVCRLLL